MLKTGVSQSLRDVWPLGRVLLCAWLLCIVVGQAMAVDIPQEIRFKRLMTGEGLNGRDNINAITSIIQDDLGFMWFGGENGLARYNGESLEVFQTDSIDPRSLSGSYVWDIEQDHDGVLWISTGQGLNRYDRARHDFSRYTTSHPGDGVAPAAAIGDDVLFSLAVGLDNTLYIGSSKGLWMLNPARDEFTSVARLRDQYIRTVTVDRGGVVWVGTSERGLWRWDRATQQWRNWQLSAGDAQSLPGNYVRTIAEDADGRIWVGTLGGGIARLNADGETFTRYQYRAGDSQTIGSNNVWDVHVDKDGHVWVASDPGGLSLYLPEEDHFRTFTHSPYSASSLNSNKVRAIFDDNLGDLWVGAFPSGVNYFDKSTALFRNYTAGPEGEQSLSHESVLRFLKDSTGRLWIGTEHGLNRFDPVTETFRHYLPDAQDPHALQAGAVLSLEEDARGQIWVGTWSGGVHTFDPVREQFRQHLPQASDPYSLGDAYVWSIVRDHKNRIWLGTESTGLHLYQPEHDRFLQFKPDPDDPQSLSFRHVWTLLEDSSRRLWVGTIDGLDLLVDVQGDKATFRHFRHEPDNSQSLSSNRIISLSEDRRGFIWVGTQDAGLNRLDPATGIVTRVSTAHGMPSAHVSSIIEDDDGYIWASTVNGLALIDPATLKVRTFGESNGLVANNFNRDASYKDDSGRLYFGSAQGFSVFDPRHFNTQTAAPEVVITNFRLFNQPVYAGAADSPLQEAISNTEELHLSHRHTMFAFDFYALSYRSAHRNKYAYKLEGFDQQWNQVGSSNTATYTNIGPGTYTFKVRGTNSDGIWSTSGQEIKIFIAPPLWRTAGAYLVYALMFALMVASIVFNQKKKIAFRHQKALNEKLLKVDRLKTAFLSNTSHELRTPLNGIIGLAEAMQEGSMGEVADSVRHGLKMISSSGRRLSNLINDILDFSKLNDNKLHIHSAPVAVRPMVDTVLELVTPLLGAKQVRLLNEVPPQAWVKADENRLQQILLNLVSNAIKFSQQGHVRIYGRQKDSEWTIFVEDTGVGISPEDSQKIFRAFTQLDQDETREQGGTGLGLAISKRLVQLHGGSIRMESQTGIGSTFEFTLPACAVPDHDTPQLPAIHVDSGTIEKLNPIISSGSDEVLGLLKGPACGESYTILVVDDDAVNRMVLCSMLQLQNYRVIEADSGAQSLSVMEERDDIDLVIMDVMMPRMSGYEACMRMRVHYPVHLLPIVFLTAKNFNDDLVRGFVAGGNDFLTKPISKPELLSRVSSHLSLLEVSRRLERKCRDAHDRQLVHQKALGRLEGMIQLINCAEDSHTLWRGTLKHVQEVTGADEVLYWTVDDAVPDRYTVIGVDGSQRVYALRDRPQINQRLAELYRAGETVVMIEKESERRLAFVRECFPACHCALLVTLGIDGEVAGFITVLSTDFHTRFDGATFTVLAHLQGVMNTAAVKADLLQRLDGGKTAEI